MAWMMDQLASIGVSFYSDTIDKIFEKSVCFFYEHPRSSQKNSDDAWHEWADQPIYDDHKPVRPWGLGELVQPETGFYRLAGKTTRTPGLYHRTDSETGRATEDFMVNTNEKIHRSVRLRLALGGLGYDDVGLYKCRALKKKGPWELEQVRVVVASRDMEVLMDGEEPEVIEEDLEDLRWAWVYNGPKEDAPPKTMMLEESLGPYEKRLLRLNKGRPFYERILEEYRR